MNYDEAMKYLAKTGKTGIVPGLQVMKELCTKLNHPETGYNIIHIAGTNGKGSTGAFIDAVLRDAGYTVCRYSSPSVMEYEEIIQYCGENITKRELAYYISKVKEAADALFDEGKNTPTRFEAETAAAFLYCRDKKCDYAVFETGMGGREDAVNVIPESRVSVLTPISLDHTAFLGNTLEEIAREKAGIIKEGGCVVTAKQSPEVMSVIEEVCREKHARLIAAAPCENIRGNVFDYDDMRDVSISLKGAFQPLNAAAAIEVCGELKTAEEHIRTGLKNAVWRGRFETICKSPLFIIDGAHNEAAARLLAETISREFSGHRINLIIGVLGDKDYEKIAEHTAHLAHRIFAVTPDNPRALSNTVLAEAIKKYNKNTYAVDLETAVGECMRDTDAVTVAFGSLSYLKDVKRAVDDEKM